MKMYNIHQAKTHLSRLLEAVAQGEEVVIAKAGTPVAKLVAFSAASKPRPLGLLAGKIWEADDAWAPDPELEAMFYGETTKPEPKLRRVAERKRK